MGIGNRPFFGGTAFTAAHGLGWFQEEFKKDGIQVEFAFFRGAGPALNEAVANNLLDIHVLGDLPSIIGRAGGLKYRRTTRGLPRNCMVLASQAFIDQYPHIVQRLVNVWVKAAHWSSQESRRSQILQLWTKSGVPFNNFKEDFEGLDLKVMFSPLIDDYIVGRYKQAVEDARRYGLIRRPVDVDSWPDRRFLEKALQEQGLQDFWPEFDASGKPKPRNVVGSEAAAGSPATAAR